MKKALILQPAGNDGCTWYRYHNIKRHIKDLSIEFIDPTLDTPTLAKIIESADVFLLRLSDIVAFALFDTLFSEIGSKPIIVDIDDNYEIVDPLSEMYHVYGVRNVQMQNGQYLWKDKQNDFSIDKNRDRLDKFKDILRRATLVTVTTFKLRQYALEYNKNVVVIPNSIDFDLFPDIPKDSKALHIVWAGGSSHYSDLMDIQEPLTRIMHKYADVHLHILGVHFKGFTKDMPQNRVHTYGWIMPDGHGYRLATVRGHIGLCPLKDMEFNKYKSSIKYYEYSALGMATLAKNIEPYSDDIVSGKTGYLYDSHEDFETKLEELINNPVLRLQMASGARDYVYKNRNSKDIAKDYSNLLSAVIEADKTIHIVKKEVDMNKLSILMPILKYNELTGSELYVYELSRELAKLGHSVTIVANSIGGEITEKSRSQGVNVIDFSKLKGVYDIIHGHQKQPTEKAIRIVKRPAVQTIHSEHEMLSYYESPADNVLHYVAIRPTIKDKYKLENCTVIYNPIDVSRFNTSGVKDKGYTLFVGSNDPIRGEFIRLLEKGNTKFIGRGFDIAPTWNIEKYVKECKMTASVYMGRTAIEGWMCGKSCVIHNPEKGTNEVLSPPDDISIFDSRNVVKQVLEVYKKVL